MKFQARPTHRFGPALLSAPRDIRLVLFALAEPVIAGPCSPETEMPVAQQVSSQFAGVAQALPDKLDVLRHNLMMRELSGEPLTAEERAKLDQLHRIVRAGAPPLSGVPPQVRELFEEGRRLLARRRHGKRSTH